MTWAVGKIYAAIFISIFLLAGSAYAKDEKASPDMVQHKVLAFNLEGLSEKGEKKWGVQGESAEAISESAVKLNNITAKAYGDEAQAVITADKGVYDKTKNNVRLEKNVRATIENTADFTGDFFKFPAPVSGTPDGNKKKTPGTGKKSKTVITCDGDVQFNYESNQAFFNKNVKVISEDGAIEADKITVNLEPSSKKIKDIVAEGNVKIYQGENVTYSDKATYIEAEKKVLLTGRPRLVIYQEGGLEKGFLGK